MIAKEKKLWLEAIQTLREHYLEYELDEIPDAFAIARKKGCPLCSTATRTVVNFPQATCRACLWIKYETTSCHGEFTTQTTQERLDRLDRWEKKIKKEA